MAPPGNKAHGDEPVVLSVRQRRPRRALAAVVRREARDPLRISLFLLILLVVSRVHGQFAILARLQPVLVLVLFAAGCAIAKPKSLSRDNPIGRWPSKVLIALAVAACLSVPFGISMGNSGRFILDSYSRVLVFAILLILSIRHADDLSLMVRAYVAGVAALVCIVFSRYDLAGDSYERIGRLYTYDPNDLGLILTVGLPFVGWIFQTSRGLWRVGSLGLIAGIAVTLVYTGSRGGFLGLMAAGVGFVVFATPVPLRKRLAYVATVALALWVAAPEAYWTRVRTVFNPTEDYNWTAPDGRKAVMSRGIGYMLDRPLLGIGIDNFGRAEGLLSSKAREAEAGVGIRWTAPHNSFVQAGAEMGIPGLLLWSALPFGGIVAMLRLSRRLPRSWLKGDWEARFLYLGTIYLPVALFTFAVASFFLSFAYMPTIYILAAFMVGLYTALHVRLRKTRAGTERPS